MIHRYETLTVNKVIIYWGGRGGGRVKGEG